jgi:CheY-like chemotaxis protein
MVPLRKLALAPVMVVEDDHDTRVSLRSFLEEEGFEVLTATHGWSAIHMLRSGAQLPGMIVLDLRMPLMDGWAFVEVIKSDPALANLPVVVITADKAAPPPDVIEVLKKPIPVDRLLQLVEHFCC